VADDASITTGPPQPLSARPALSPQRFIKERWSRKLAAWVVFGEFAKNANWQQEVAHPAFNWRALPATDNAVDREKLFEYATSERADALAEIIAQDGNGLFEFQHLLSVTEASHPRICQLLYVADLVGALVVMHVKYREDRPRPSQLYPALRPALPIPGHSSYPSGHATQAFLMWHCLKEAIVASGLSQVDKDHWSAAILTLADRIAVNRERAGLHYPSDTQAGRELAQKLLVLLKTIPHFNVTVTEAAAEWDRAS